MKEIKKAKTIYELPILWDKEQIKKTLKRQFPDFILDKVELQPSKVCQLSCPWCWGKNLIPAMKYRSEVPLETYKQNVLEPIYKIKPSIMIAGLYSEPLLYSQFTELIALVNKMGFRFGLYTNGLTLNKELIEIILYKSHPYSYISLDFSASKYAGVDIYEKIKMLVKIRNKYNPTLQINIPMFFLWEIQELKKIEKKLLNIGVDSIRYRKTTTPYYSYKELMGTDKVYFNIKPFNRCCVLLNSVSIAPDGYVYPCSYTSSLEFFEFNLGSILKENIIDIWKKRQKFWFNFDPSREVCECNYYDNEWNRYCHHLRN